MSASEVRVEIRAAELAAVIAHLPIRGTVLDLGAGPGLQTDLLLASRREVVGLDLLDGSYRPGRRMIWFDGVRVPLRSQSVDAVFSSHVLEHVDDLVGLFEELTRAIRPGGIAVHIVPTATWRSLGLITRWGPIFAAVVRRVTGRPAPGCSPGPDEGARPEFPTDPRSLWRSVLVPLPHGAHHSALGEVVAFSRWSWRRSLRRTGWAVEGPIPLGIAYSGTHAGTTPTMATRRQVARLTGSSSAAWVLRPPAEGHGR